MTWDIWFSLLTHFILLSLLAGRRRDYDGARYAALCGGKASLALGGAVCQLHCHRAGSARAQYALHPAAGLANWPATGRTTLAATAGLLATFIGIMIPSSTLTFAATRWLQNNSQHVIARASKASLAPISIALLLATSWLLASAHGDAAKHWPLWLFSAAALLLAWKTRIHLLLILGTGALLGMFGLI